VNERANTNTAIWRSGSGPKLVLLHGEFADARTYWGPISGALASHFDLILPDLPGFGDSAPLPDYRPQTYLLWLKRLVDALGLESGVGGRESDEGRGETGPRPVDDGADDRPVEMTTREGGEAEQIILGGAGHGATIARLFAARHRALVRRLILSGGGSVERPGPLRSLLSRLIPVPRVTPLSGGPRSVRDLFSDPDRYCTAELVDRFDSTREATARIRRAFDQAPLPAALTPVCTTLLLWGNEDRYCPITAQEAIAAEIKDPRQVDIYDAGHLVMIEQPHRFSAHVLDFLQS